MKNYLNFNLTGKKLLPIWLLFMVFFIVPYAVMIFKMKQFQTGVCPSTFIFLILILMIVIAFVITYFIAKLTIEGLAFKDKPIVFTGSFGKYIGVVLPGFLLSIITLGIYMAWFVRNIHRFFINNSTYNTQNFNFLGKGGKLFLILLLSLIAPIIILSIVLARPMACNINHYSTTTAVYQLIGIFIIIPYIYLIYKWMVNINYKGFNIIWETNFWNSCGKIAAEMILTMITLGIYMPLAIIRLYKYFADRTVAVGNECKYRFGYDIDPLNDFLFIWGQILLTIVTMGIYYSWAYCKIGKRILSKTYLAEN